MQHVCYIIQIEKTRVFIIVLIYFVYFYSDKIDLSPTRRLYTTC